MSEGGGSNPFASFPPWIWAIVLLGGGGGIGTFSGLSMESHENCAEKSELLQLQSDLDSARNGLLSANETIQSLIEVIKDKNSPNGWIE